MFKSIAQQRYLFAKKPKIAEEFAEKTPKSAYNTLPMHEKDVDGQDKMMKKEDKMHQKEKMHPETARIHESEGMKERKMKNRFDEYNKKHRRSKNEG